MIYTSITVQERDTPRLHPPHSAHLMHTFLRILDTLPSDVVAVGARGETHEMPGEQVQKSVVRNKEFIVAQFGHNADLIVRDFSIGRRQACIITITGLVDKLELSQSVLSPLLKHQGPVTENTIINTLSAVDITTTDSLSETSQKISQRNTVLFVDGIKTAFLLDVSATLQRSLAEPRNETVVRGPHVGFVENIIINVSLLRRYVNNPQLRIELYTLGTQTSIQSALVYLEDTADDRIVSMVKARLQAVEADGILGSGFVEQLVEDAPYSIFPTIRHTERPDTLAGSLLEGRVGILVDASPDALIVPHLFLDNFHIAEDYHSRPYYSSFMRLLRFLGFFMSTQLPGVYIAIENFHKELLPSPLLISLAGAREGVPFPLGMEIFLMMASFEVIKEAGLRMPQPLGASVGIVAGLVLGETAVNSGIVGTSTIIVAATAGLSSFLFQTLTEVSTLLRFLLIIPASFVGLYGVILADLMVTIHVVSLKSFGVPYMAPIVPAYFRDWKDTLIRLSLKRIRPENKQTRHNVGRYLE